MSDLAELIEEMQRGRLGEQFEFNPPTTMAEILDAERALPFPLPAFYKEFLLLANGAVVFQDTFYGIFPAGKPASELLHPRTLAWCNTVIDDVSRKRWFWEHQPYPWTLPELVSTFDLVSSSAPKHFEEIDFGFGEIEYKDKLIMVGRTDTGDIYVVKPDDERLYIWYDDSTVLNGESPGSLVNELRQMRQWMTERLAKSDRQPKTGQERLRRWFGGGAG